MTQVPFYFDFISPYSWLALTQAPDMSSRLGIRWVLRPVVYAKLLEAHSLLGPGEVPAKRQAMFADVVRCARLLGQPFSGPPAHPFRSLESLRVACLFRKEDGALDLCLALANAAWAEGRDLTDMAVLTEVVAGQGLPADGLEDRIREPDLKADLRALTQGALATGVFGVPTFIHDGELFWGQDRLRHLEARITGDLPAAREQVEELLKRPRGTDRPSLPTIRK